VIRLGDLVVILDLHPQLLSVSGTARQPQRDYASTRPSALETAP
jgi:hypothetical protein